MLSSRERNDIAHKEIKENARHRWDNNKHHPDAITKQPRYVPEMRLTREEAEELRESRHLLGGYYIPTNFPQYFTTNEVGGGYDMHMVMSDREAEVLKRLEELMNRVHYGDMTDVDKELESIVYDMRQPGPLFKD